MAESAPALAVLLQSLTPDEVHFIAQRDDGQDAERHSQALASVVARGGRFEQGEEWYPYEVVELGAHTLVRGHAREFAICTLLVIAAVADGFDLSTTLADKFQDRADDYAKLPPDLQQAILAAYAAT
ncbi:hypothetical protein Xkhy_03820 [Xanthomonas axonopodis pv. khayae]|uniref:Uncharacterized protein n=2 Tax=Xanthomonas TaxID=338 RepID=A0AA44YYE1_XANCM|nr:hypothetical protein APY29_22200 [Xanthomonas citri pv. malvacearum]MBE0316965.1 hypothetical protein [Xanthomonas citri pv. punicae]NMI13902.1 hypothetical protein [Xanthomonas citri]OOW54733.1 hypothetical protein Xcnt_07710 [Xanthomonas campestris pv. centellae]OOW62439.1 hypothetical protein Xths_15525 [Xanthomonas campestris pv. thespesiae]OOW71069.1 hypothetical protein Xmlh_09870 [Xanthomonas axonopodis pv. melhusii]OOW74564.1 hypothetical protein Xlen_06230 [Xanthomonas campestris 